MVSPWQAILTRQGVVVLDGGLATELEADGHDLSDDLWSARLLRDEPAAIARVHARFLEAGADCLITASYQASFSGFAAAGLGPASTAALLQRAVDLAVDARDDFWRAPPPGRLRPLVAASVGPYGAFLANGAEYTGDYDLDVEGLTAFHRRRWEILAASKADLLACETLPSWPEAQALVGLLRQTPGRMAWFSFTCRNGRQISDGTAIERVAAALNGEPQVAAIGVNCTPPRYIPELLQRLWVSTTKPIIVYPNSGETWQATTHSWTGHTDPSDFGSYSREWRKMGAAIIGGCCRTGPAHIRQIRDRIPGASR